MGIIARDSGDLREAEMAMTEREAVEQVRRAADLPALEAVRVELLGRKGVVTEELKAVGVLPVAERAAAGAAANRLRQAIESALAERSRELGRVAAEAAVSQPVDVTAPGIRPKLGHRHPVSMVLDELVDVFWQMGYQVADGPEVETEWYNFEALNIPPEHPARDMQGVGSIAGVPRREREPRGTEGLSQEPPGAAAR